MHLFTLICGIVLLHKAYSLKCHDCPTPDATGTCTKTMDCPTVDFRCGALSITAYAGGAKISEVGFRRCAAAAECIEGGSINFGIARTVIASECCTTDLCNSQPATAPSTSSPNGKKCFTCQGQSCSATLNCDGKEDHCISTKMIFGGQKLTVKGCATKSMCSATGQMLPGGLEGSISCCEGDLCNSAFSTSASLLILVASLLSLVMFS